MYIFSEKNVYNSDEDLLATFNKVPIHTYFFDKLRAKLTPT